MDSLSGRHGELSRLRLQADTAVRVVSSWLRLSQQQIQQSQCADCIVQTWICFRSGGAAEIGAAVCINLQVLVVVWGALVHPKSSAWSVKRNGI